MITRSQSGIVKPIDRFSLNTFLISPIPKNPSDALKNLQWRNAMYDEYNVLVKNGTWLLVPRPAGVNMVRSLWLFKHKFHADGTLSRYKALLVANGSNQQLGVDFDETFSAVVKPANVRTVLSLVVSRKCSIHQLDIKNAFLNSDLSKTVYMHQPLGFVDARFHNHVMPHGSDFIRVVATLLYLFVDGIIDSLHNEFDMNDLGSLNYFLGIFADRNSIGLFLSQKNYALQLLERAHMVHCNHSRTPVDTESKFGPDGVPVQDPTLYRSLVGGLQYLTFTRPDLSYDVQHLCLYMHDPREPHVAALKRILRYVLGTVDFGLQLYASATTSLVGYTDADWAGCPSARRSTSVNESSKKNAIYNDLARIFKEQQNLIIYSQLPAVMEFIRNHLISSIILVMISSAASLTFNLPNIGTKNQNREIFTQGVWASISNSGIQVTPDEIGSDRILKCGKAIYFEPFHLWDERSGELASFSTNFTFVIDSRGNRSYADGLTFFLAQNTSDMFSGGSMGLPFSTSAGVNNTNQFVAVEFDTYWNQEWDPKDSRNISGIDDHVGISPSLLAVTN
ncbi:ribonuclease H-like domain-containing protein [Tanacetum coccineum]